MCGWLGVVVWRVAWVVVVWGSVLASQCVDFSGVFGFGVWLGGCFDWSLLEVGRGFCFFCRVKVHWVVVVVAEHGGGPLVEHLLMDSLFYFARWWGFVGGFVFFSFGVCCSGWGGFVDFGFFLGWGRYFLLVACFCRTLAFSRGCLLGGSAVFFGLIGWGWLFDR